MDLKWGKPNSIVTENDYRSWVHCMTLVVMTVEDILLSAIMTFMTLLCQSYDREIDFLTRDIRTVLILNCLELILNCLERRTNLFFLHSENI